MAVPTSTPSDLHPCGAPCWSSTKHPALCRCQCGGAQHGVRHLPNATARARFASPVTAFSSLPQAETDADLAEWGITARASKAGAA